MRPSGCPTRETAPRQARSHCPPEAIYRAALFREVRDAAATAGIVRAVATAGAIDGVFTQPRPTADTKKNPSTARRHLAEPSAGSGAVLSPRGARAAQGLPLPCAAAGIADADMGSLRDRDRRSSSGADRGEKDVTESARFPPAALVVISAHAERRQNASKMPAAPMPVPMHIVTMPYFLRRRRSPCMSVAVRIAPVAPSG